MIPSGRLRMTVAIVSRANPNARMEQRNVGVLLLVEGDVPEGEQAAVHVESYAADVGAIFPSASGEQLSEVGRDLAATMQAALRVSGTRLPRNKVLRRIRSLSPKWPISIKTSYEVTVYSTDRSKVSESVATELARAVYYCLSPEGCPSAPKE